MLFLALLSLAQADPTSLRGEASFQLFRRPLDLVVQPARLAGTEETAVYTFLALRAPETVLSAGATVTWGPGALGVHGGWHRSGAGTRSGSVSGPTSTLTRDDADRAVLHVAYGAPVTGTVDVGGGVWFDGAFASSPRGWEAGALTTQAELGPDEEPALWSRRRTWSLGARLGTTLHDPRGGHTDLHVELAGEEDLAVTEGELPGVVVLEGFTPDGAGGPQANRLRWQPAVVVDGLRPTGPRSAFRAWARVGLAAGGPSVLARREAPVGAAERRTELLDPGGVDLAVDGTLLLLGHVTAGPVEIRVGGRVRADVHHRVVLWLVDPDAPGTVAQGRAQRGVGIDLALPLALEVAVHRRVVLRAAALGGWQWTDTTSLVGTADLLDPAGTLDGTVTGFPRDGTYVRGGLGVAWRAADLVSLEAALDTAYRSANVQVAAPSGVVTGGLSTPLGDLGLAVSLVFHP